MRQLFGSDPSRAPILSLESLTGILSRRTNYCFRDRRHSIPETAPAEAKLCDSNLMTLNGWKRIGIVASVLWILGAWVHTYLSGMDRASRFITSTHVACDSYLGGRTGDAWTKGFNECNKQADDSFALARSNARRRLLRSFRLWLGLRLSRSLSVRWVKRGFMRPL